jgi:hypothetical protein
MPTSVQTSGASHYILSLVFIRAGETPSWNKFSKLVPCYSTSRRVCLLALYHPSLRHSHPDSPSLGQASNPPAAPTFPFSTSAERSVNSNHHLEFFWVDERSMAMKMPDHTTVTLARCEGICKKI